MRVTFLIGERVEECQSGCVGNVARSEESRRRGRKKIRLRTREIEGLRSTATETEEAEKR